VHNDPNDVTLSNSSPCGPAPDECEEEAGMMQEKSLQSQDTQKGKKLMQPRSGPGLILEPVLKWLDFKLLQHPCL
jgi:hypothetical protein